MKATCGCGCAAPRTVERTVRRGAPALPLSGVPSGNQPGGQPGSPTPATPPGFTGRLLGAAQWLVPSIVLALTPKCPVCLAAYVALGTGVGLSLPAAAFLRGSMLVLGGGSLAFLVARLLYRSAAPRGFLTGGRSDGDRSGAAQDS